MYDTLFLDLIVWSYFRVQLFHGHTLDNNVLNSNENGWCSFPLTNSKHVNPQNEKVDQILCHHKVTNTHPYTHSLSHTDIDIDIDIDIYIYREFLFKYIQEHCNYNPGELLCS